MKTTFSGPFAFAACVLTVTGCGSSKPTTSSDAIALSDSADEVAARANHRGNVVIADQYNNRVIELDRHHHIVWTFGDGSSVPSPTSVVAPNDAERIGSYTLIAGTGAPAGAEPSCDTGCNDNRVLLVDRHGQIVWQYGADDGTAGSGDNQLNTPVSAVFLPNGHVLIADQGNARIIEVNGDKKVVWQYGTTGTSGAGPNQLNNPNSAELLDYGTVLIADENNNRVIEVDRDGDIVWSYGSPSDTTSLNGAAFASRLDNGNTLITDANNSRVVEVTPDGKVAWSFVTNTRPGSNATPQPTRGVRLRNGDTLISDQNNHQVIEVDLDGDIVWSQGTINTPGSDNGLLNGPYDAKVVGDYTGLTSPFGE